MVDVSDEEAGDVYAWLRKKGVSFQYGPIEETDLTEEQVLLQCGEHNKEWQGILSQIGYG